MRKQNTKKGAQISQVDNLSLFFVQLLQPCGVRYLVWLPTCAADMAPAFNKEETGKARCWCNPTYSTNDQLKIHAFSNVFSDISILIHDTISYNSAMPNGGILKHFWWVHGVGSSATCLLPASPHFPSFSQPLSARELIKMLSKGCCHMITMSADNLSDGDLGFLLWFPSAARDKGGSCCDRHAGRGDYCDRSTCFVCIKSDPYWEAQTTKMA